MKFASTGILVGYPSNHRDAAERRSGFTLVETLVALSLLLAFAAALGPVLSGSRHLLARGDGRVRAELLLRSLLESPADRSDREVNVREGESAGFRWRLAIEPFVAAAMLEPQSDTPAGKSSYNWSLYKIKARVFWGDNQSVTAETLRLGRTD